MANFGVPGFAGERSAVIQPILSNRYRVLFYNFGFSGEIAPYDMTRQMRSVGRPNVQFETQSLYSYVSTVYIVTRAEWQEITVRLFDDITNSVQTRVQQQVSKQMNFFDQTMSRAGENYKFEMDIDVLAGGASAGGSSLDPNILQRWSLSGCMITSTDMGELTYENATGMEISVPIRYDNCVVFNQNGLRLGTFSHTPEIQSRRGILSTGAGVAGGLSVNLSGNSVSVGLGGFGLNF